TIKKYLPLPPLPKPTTAPKAAYGTVNTSCYIGDIFQFLEEFGTAKIQSLEPATFEALSQPSGFVLYSTKVPIHPNDPPILKVPGLKDRAHIFVNRKYKGILSRQLKIFQIPLTDVYQGDELQILVENQGRICFDKGIDEAKGIIGLPTLDNFPLVNWTNQGVPLHDEKIMSKWISKGCQSVPEHLKYSFTPSFFKGSLKIA